MRKLLAGAAIGMLMGAGGAYAGIREFGGGYQVQVIPVQEPNGHVAPCAVFNSPTPQGDQPGPIAVSCDWNYKP